MKIKKITAIALVLLVVAGLIIVNSIGKNKQTEIKEFTAFFSVPGTELNKNNYIQNIIAEKTGVKINESWLHGQTGQEAVAMLISTGDYPDFIDGGDSSKQLYEAGALIALDDYLEKYPNIKALYSDDEWNRLRQDDGHIYWIPQFQNIKGEDSSCTHNDEAFWIQARVLKWAGYPEIRTLDQYFDLLEAYYEANPTMEDGTPNIPYTILCEDWRYFCLENVPQFLDGYPNDGSVIVDTDTMEVVDYNTTPTAKAYFMKLNEEFHKGIVDPESFTQTYEEYIAKLSSGRVLGMVDQWWDFAYTAGDAIVQAGLDKQGCEYVPLPITISEDVQNKWHTSGGVINISSGLAVTTSCEDVEGALQFISDLLDQDIHNLRFWGVEGIDYEIDDDGLFYRTPEQRANIVDTSYKLSHMCGYSYFPQWGGTSDDGINANLPIDQPGEFYDGLSDSLKECFSAYGVRTYVEMLGTNESPGIWYPMYSYSNSMTTATSGGYTWIKMNQIKHEYLPQVVMSDDFSSMWKKYMKAYKRCNPQDFLDEMQAELDRRISTY
ncbi:MAG: extracellular solute-binding protein [Butyrivibrio sp.]|uniref:extracellular solute-binding protein n=1 Tax=Butyrivibrio sp. TaxID=28121 RepID=UPI0025E66D64|nr:extracellular solute-binding protein [Butyrivibrio sp.]MCR5773135.1 extracellular solute-binding protein [Butyrivibrio sp.]